VIEFAEVPIGRGGVLACEECGEGRAPEPFAASKVAAALEGVAGATPRPEGVTLAGFEPFAHPELPEIVASAVEAGFVRVRLRTDGGALGLHGNAAGVLAAGVRHIEVVLFGDPETHDRLTRREGLYQAALRGVRAFREAAASSGCGVFVSGVLPLCAHNIGVAAGAVVAFAEMGAGAVELDASRLPAADRVVLAAALDTATVNGMHAWVPDGGFAAPYDRGPWKTGDRS
jgi:hypothetical protein